LLRSATSCFGCSTNVNESFPLIAAALDQNLGLEVDVGAALNIVADVMISLGSPPTEQYLRNVA
jgi:hypothetical protein